MADRKKKMTLPKSTSLMDKLGESELLEYAEGRFTVMDVPKEQKQMAKKIKTKAQEFKKRYGK
jgi:hypothetical protein|tara:strand:- start:1146 stop:1334 length:189 start_codon:yes stop_codon:yes gene_type:complete